ncbi:hypothetical protein D7V80_14995 [Corallococcus sp. CA054B]|uniref:hypothetical protein n=1 Tax=Corallococcus sp. CA054B TaxID=2316734 RepID=UPI000EA3CFEC|nr:hypothetical protein [Corallococcus sp. CA054B]RKG67802.1 hypothetical protein D7V80_14995 [Corallococcus sp. CA054B]
MAVDVCMKCRGVALEAEKLAWRQKAAEPATRHEPLPVAVDFEYDSRRSLSLLPNVRIGDEPA